MTLQRCDISSKRAVLPRRNDARMGPRQLATRFSAIYRVYRQIWFHSIIKLRTWIFAQSLYYGNRPVGRAVTRSSLEREVWGSNLGPVKSDTVLPTARHRCDIYSKGAVLPGRNEVEMDPANSLHASAYYSEYIERFDLLYYGYLTSCSDVGVHHWDKKWGLTSAFIINSASIRDKADLFHQSKKVFQHPFNRVVHFT